MICKKRKKILIDILKLFSPGTILREALDNILYGRTGALIVIGTGNELKSIIDGGFKIDAELNPNNLYELSKMDGAIILNENATRIHFANVQLNPSPDVISWETGIRHRIAERVARQTKLPVISVSQRRNIITLFREGTKYILQDIPLLLVKANQALQTLERHKNVFDQGLINLNAMEFEGIVTVEEVAKSLQRSEVVLRISEIIERYIVELGKEGTLIQMQLEELLGNLREEQKLLVRDYYTSGEDHKVEKIIERLDNCSDDEMMEPANIARLLGHGTTPQALEKILSSRGYRLLSKIPRLPMAVIENVVQVFDDIPTVMKASLEKLDCVEGIGEVRAKTIKKGLSRIREQSLIEREL